MSELVRNKLTNMVALTYSLSLIKHFQRHEAHIIGFGIFRAGKVSGFRRQS